MIGHLILVENAARKYKYVKLYHSNPFSVPSKFFEIRCVQRCKLDDLNVRYILAFASRNSKIKLSYRVTQNLHGVTNFISQGQRSRSKVKVKCHRNVITFTRHHKTCYYKVVSISFIFAQTD